AEVTAYVVPVAPVGVGPVEAGGEQARVNRLREPSRRLADVTGVAPAPAGSDDEEPVLAGRGTVAVQGDLDVGVHRSAEPSSLVDARSPFVIGVGGARHVHRCTE